MPLLMHGHRPLPGIEVWLNVLSGSCGRAPFGARPEPLRTSFAASDRRNFPWFAEYT
jgi:hypothetical protein